MSTIDEEQRTQPLRSNRPPSLNGPFPPLQPLAFSKQKSPQGYQQTQFPPSPSTEFPLSPTIAISGVSNEYAFQRNSGTPSISSIEASPVRSAAFDLPKEKNVVDTTKLHSGNLQRSASAQEYSKTKSVHRTLSGSSYQESPIEPTLSAKSTPALFGNPVETNAADWGEFFCLSEEFINSLDPAMVRLQHEIHHLISTEENYVQSVQVFLEIFGNGLSDTLPTGAEDFRHNAFVSLEQVLALNDKVLLKAFKEEQGRNGPMLKFKSKAVMEWAMAVREPLLWFAECHPHASNVIRIQSKTNERFKAFIEHGSAESTRKVRKEFSALFECTHLRFGQYQLILKSIQKQIRKLDEKDPEIDAIDEIMQYLNKTMSIYNETQGRVGDQIQVMNLEKALSYKNPSEKVDLKLTEDFEQMPHKILYQSKVMMKKSEIDSMENLEMILLDHYLLLVNVKNEMSVQVVYKPIHLELLAIESGADDPMFKRSAKAVVNKLTRNKSEATNSHSNSMRRSTAASTQSANTPTSRNSSISSEGYFSRRSVVGMQEYSAGGGGFIAQNNDMIYPIKLRNLATEQKYYICTSSEITRREWVKRLCSAKEDYSRRAQELNLNPISLRIIDSTSFGYPITDKTTVLTNGNPVQVALANYGAPPASPATPMSPASSMSAGSQNAVTGKFKSVATINCALEVIYNGMRVIFLGLEDSIYGCFVPEPGSPINWVQVTMLPHVTRLEMVKDENFFFVLSERTLYAYKSNEILLSIISAGQRSTVLKVSAPIIISTTVDCFKAGNLSQKPYVFYSAFTSKSTVTVLEFAGKETQKRSSRLFFKTKTIGNGEFKESDSLFTPTENGHIEFFNKTFCIYTTNSFEVMNLERKKPQTIPTEESILTIAQRQGLQVDQAESLKKQISMGRPIYMAKFQAQYGVNRTSHNILVYHKLAIICDALGDLASASMVKYQVHKIKAARLWYPYLFLFSDRVIEIHRLTGRADISELVQVITGRDIKLLGASGDGSGALGMNIYNRGASRLDENTPRVIVSMAHPENPANVLLMEFELNEKVTQIQRRNSLVYA